MTKNKLKKFRSIKFYFGKINLIVKMTHAHNNNTVAVWHVRSYNFTWQKKKKRVKCFKS